MPPPVIVNVSEALPPVSVDVAPSRTLAFNAASTTSSAAKSEAFRLTPRPVIVVVPAPPPVRVTVEPVPVMLVAVITPAPPIVTLTASTSVIVEFKVALAASVTARTSLASAPPT